MEYPLNTKNTISSSNINDPVSHITGIEDHDISEHLSYLRDEYKNLIKALNVPKARRDPFLQIRLMIIMIDLGLYQPSPP